MIYTRKLIHNHKGYFWIAQFPPLSKDLITNFRNTKNYITELPANRSLNIRKKC